MAREYQTVKIWKQTLTNLRLLSALIGKRMVVVLDELVSKALAKEQRGGKGE